MSDVGVFIREQAEETVLPERKGRQWRFPVLCSLLALAIGYNIFLAFIAPPIATTKSWDDLFITLWLVSFLPYLAACVVIFVTQAPTGSKRWIELALILVGALVLRAQLVWIPPNLSNDSWRYLWDARVALNGYSPYIYVPDSPILYHLRDVLYNNSRFRNAPTLYPPVAQLFYVVSYLIAPENLVFFKCLLILCDLVSTGVLAVLLMRKGYDPARCIIYGWSPLAIIEFAIQGHLDAITVALMVLVVLAAQHSGWRARVLTGVLLAMATLTKFYPILMFVFIWRPRDWVMPLTCALTAVLAYIPYIILSHGLPLGFFASYASQYSPNGGLLAHWMYQLRQQFGINPAVTYVIDFIVVGGIVALTWYLHLKQRISIAGAMLMLTGTAFMASTAIFPWYTVGFLPWVTLLAGPAWKQVPRWGSRELVVLAFWYFSSMTITAYYISLALNWNSYYISVYYVTLVCLGIAVWWRLQWRPLPLFLKRGWPLKRS
jgi:hypothetical protein